MNGNTLSGKLERKEREYKARRAEILANAERIFAQKGFHNAPMAEIAAASGFAIGTLYQYFKGKEDLYACMVTEKLLLMYAEITKAVLRKENLIDRIRALILTHFKFVEQNIDFCRLLIRGESVSYSDGNTTLKEKFIENHISHVDFIERILADGVRQKRFKSINTRAMACALVGMMNSFKFHWIVDPDGRSLTAKVPVVMDIFMKGVGLNEN
jgi:AcrR family transcriptional regulator